MLLTYFKSKLCAESTGTTIVKRMMGEVTREEGDNGGWEGMSELELHSIAHEMAQTVAGLAEQALSY